VLSGEVDASTYHQLAEELEALVAHGGEDVHLHLGALNFIDVAGACCVQAASRRLAAGRRLVLHQPPYQLIRMISLMWPEPGTIVVEAR
jgi:anti-anti-sigma regulatory factor